VHPGTELLHVVNYLAGVYQPTARQSSYLDAVETWFGKYREHPAVVHAAALPYNDFTDLGWCFDFPDNELKIPDGYGYLDKIMDREYLERYLILSREFAEKSDFWAFYQEQEPNYRIWEKEFADGLEREQPLAALRYFYRADLGKTIYFSIAPMGATLKVNLFLEEINPEFSQYAPIIVPFDRAYVDEQTETPNFAYNRKSLNHAVWHEASHLYWEVLVAPFRQRLLNLDYEDALSVNFNTFADKGMDTYFFIHEVVADGVAILLKRKFSGIDEADAHLAINEGMGSPLYREMVELLDWEYYPNREEQNFREFIPHLIEMIENKNH